jgi:hypothetical protein
MPGIFGPEASNATPARALSVVRVEACTPVIEVDASLSGVQ